MINKPPDDLQPEDRTEDQWGGNGHRFRTPDQLRRYLDNLSEPEVDLKAYPISGEPEVFRYFHHEQVVTRDKDGRTFNSVDDFLNYAFQCDAEGYPFTEHVDIIAKRPSP